MMNQPVSPSNKPRNWQARLLDRVELLQHEGNIDLAQHGVLERELKGKQAKTKRLSTIATKDYVAKSERSKAKRMSMNQWKGRCEANTTKEAMNLLMNAKHHQKTMIFTQKFSETAELLHQELRKSHDKIEEMQQQLNAPHIVESQQKLQEITTLLSELQGIRTRNKQNRKQKVKKLLQLEGLDLSSSSSHSLTDLSSHSLTDFMDDGDTIL